MTFFSLVIYLTTVAKFSWQNQDFRQIPRPWSLGMIHTRQTQIHACSLEDVVVFNSSFNSAL